ncbi:MAG TPA: PilN domain-containing protein [Methylocystis sp.]|jgi:general secretion pathway protein L
MSWHRKEFFSFFSPKTVAWLTDRDNRQLILRAGSGDLWCLDGRGAPLWRLSTDEIAASTLEEALGHRGVARDATRIGLELDASGFLVRRFDIPAVALGNLAKLLAIDIERKTPFRLEEVVYGHTIAKNSSALDKLSVTLWILRRDFVVGAIENAGIALSDISFIRPSGLRGSEEVPLIELERPQPASDRFRIAAIGFCAATFLLAAIGVGATLWRQSALIGELNAKIEEMSARAARVRRAVDLASSESRLLSVLREARRGSPPFGDLWEEAARILPDGAFVTTFALTEPKRNEKALEIEGFADSAVGLPALFNKSPLFADAGLTAPITPDSFEKRERFSLEAKIKERKGTTSR